MSDYKPGQPDLTRIVGLAEAEEGFQTRLSEKASALLRQLKSKAKSVSSLSERDQSTFRQLQRVFNEYKGSTRDIAEPIAESEPAIAAGQIVYHAGRKVYGVVEADSNKLVVVYAEKGRNKHMTLNKEWAAASDEDATAFRNSSEFTSKALQVVDQAIEGQIADADMLDVVADELEELGKLSPKEQAELAQIESEIREALPEWDNLNDLLGSRFEEIQRRKLFRATHRSFVKYIFDTFGVTRAKAYQLMITAEVKAAIMAGGEEQVLPSQRAAQTVNQITQSIKAMLGADYEDRLIENYDRDLHKFVWSVTLQSAPKDATGKALITPAHLDSVKETIGHIIRTGTVTVDGEDIPVSGLSVFVDHNITEESHERSQRLKDGIVNEVNRSQQRRSEPQERSISISKKDGQKLTNKLQLLCSEHGEVKVTKFVFGGLALTCGCKFVKSTDSDELIHTDIIV